tara:strand:+ start:323 stop:568 length:246 start_codon:yes stop_codon:yes gene_type:complete
MPTSNFRKICIRLLIVSASILLACYFGIIFFKYAFVDFMLLELPFSVVLGSVAVLISTLIFASLLLMFYPNRSQAQNIDVK